jgi:hypothetical protein
MLNFEIKLSLTACEVLVSLVDYTDALDAVKGDKAKISAERNAELFGQMVRHKPSHFITHGNVLARNGLVEHTGRTWRVTLKGRLMAQVIRIELAEAAKNVKAVKV